MSSVAEVKNGQLINSTTQASNSSISKAEKAASKEAGGTLDKDAFLQLLVAQMKYQDPLEPTDNTEYVSQLATFSELEEMQNMVKSSDMQRASALVGEYVSVEQKDSAGNIKNVEGYVDGVIYQGNKTYLKINDVLYDFDDLDKVYDESYVYAQKLAEAAAKAQEQGTATDVGTDVNEAEADEDKAEEEQGPQQA